MLPSRTIMLLSVGFEGQHTKTKSFRSPVKNAHVSIRTIYIYIYFPFSDIPFVFFENRKLGEFPSIFPQKCLKNASVLLLAALLTIAFASQRTSLTILTTYGRGRHASPGNEEQGDGGAVSNEPTHCPSRRRAASKGRHTAQREEEQ